MGRKIGLMLGVAASCTLLAACFGGGDDSSPSPTPTPTASPTPSPTPTATPTPTAFGFASAFTSVVSNTSYSYAFFTPTGGAETWNDGSRQNGASSIAYAVSPESVSFKWPDTAVLVDFAAADRTSATPMLRTYRKGTNAIALELPFAHILRASYERVDSFTRDGVAGLLRSNRVTLFFNQVTTTAAIAADLFYTGTAQVTGGTPKVSPDGIFSATPATFKVTASDKKIAGTLQIVETVGGVATVRAVLPLTATLAAGDSFNGTIDDTTYGFKGAFSGALAGPNREEMLLVFNVTHTDGREFIGSLVAD
ncbi:hypothetical protein [Tsuneonella sp. HG222]